MLHSIAASQAFLPTFANWLDEHYATQLADTHIWLPTRRAGAALTKALAQQSGGHIVLPRIFALGKPEEACLSLPMAPPIIPPIIDGLERQLALASCLSLHSSMTPDEALRLAPALCDLLDDIQRHQLSLSVGLERMQPSQLSGHWQAMAELLALIGEPWHAWLRQEKRIEPVAAHNRLMKHLCDYAQQHPPRHPIIIAGSTGSTPSTRHLMQAVLALPQGHVILPHAQSQPAEADHPQACFQPLRNLFTEHTIQPIGAAINTHWSDAAFDPPALPPAHTLPPTATHLTANHELEEAELACLLLREAAEQNHTTHLITPHATSATHIQTQCRQRYGLEVDSSFGSPLTGTAAGTWLQHCFQLAQPVMTAHAVLALLHHPDSGWTAEQLSQLSQSCLRDMPERCALDAILHRCPDELKALWQPWQDALQRLKQTHSNASPISLQQWLAAMEPLCSLATQLNWQEAWQEWKDTHSTLQQPAMRWASLMQERLVQQKTFISQKGHPNLYILSPMEARLLHAEHVILLGLEEGSWPSQQAAQPWMSLAMRQRFGFPDTSERLALEAHDVQSLLHSPIITLIHCTSREHAPTLPSRWAEGLTLHYPELATQQPDIATWHQQWRRAPSASTPISPPAPTPPVEARPKRWAVTTAEKLLKNPYAVYCSHILQIRPLKPLGMAQPNATYGSLLHRIAEDYTNAVDDTPSEAWPSLWQQHMKCQLATYTDQTMLHHFWQQRLHTAGEFLVRHDTEQPAQQHLAEQQGQVCWASEQGTELTLTARTDRIECNGTDWHIIDYKTGSTAITQTAVKEGNAPQLPLTAWIASLGGYATAEQPQQLRFSYMQLATRNQSLEERTLDADAIEQLAEQWQAMLEQASLDASFPFLACPNPAFAPKDDHNDTAHLERRAEWASQL